jgi:hypothetical protein
LIKHAAEAEYRSLAADATPEAQAKRFRHVLYLAVLVAHGLAQVLHEEPIPRNAGHTSSHSRGRRGTVAREKPSSLGWEFEKKVLGGVMVRLAERLKRSHPDTFIVSTS